MALYQPKPGSKIIPVAVTQPHTARHDHDHDHDHDHSHSHDQAACCSGDACSSTLTAAPAAADAPAGSTAWRLAIPAMDCPTEGRLVDKVLANVTGVLRVDFNYIERSVTVHQRDASLAQVQAALASTGMPARLLTAHEADAAVAAPVESRGQLWLAGLLAAAAEGAVLAGASDGAWWVAALAMASMLAGGRTTARKGWYALKLRTLNIYFLMSLAVLGAMVLQQWPEAAMVLFLFALSEKLEALSLARAGEAVRSLMALKPDSAWVEVDGQWQAVPSDSLQVGRVVRVRPGERVPLDGVIVSGRSDFNEAPITGESLPLDKGEGDAVFAGAINGQGLVLVRVTAAADGSVLARIIRSVRDAQAGKAATQRFIDRFAAVYTPIVVAVAVLLALGLPLAGWMTWQAALYQALVLLVIACPCALVIATPVTLVSALSSAARRGMLVKGGAALEAAARIRYLALDKTGTLTRGEPVIADILLQPSGPARDAVLQVAASLEAHSTHPLARAVLQAAAGLPLLAATDLQETAGEGVQATVGGQRWALGNRRLLARLGADIAPWLPRVPDGSGEMWLCRDGEPQALLLVADALRPDAVAAVAQLQQMGIALTVLSGDQQAVVGRTAAQAGIGEALGGLLPDDKLAHIRRLAQQGPVAMVGDGVNDAPALAQAELGIAMGAAGSDTALETAQVALMEDRLDKLPQLFAHARRSMAVLRANIVLALGIKLLFFILALAGVATLWMAVFADVGASLLVIFNGLRLARVGKAA